MMDHGVDNPQAGIERLMQMMQGAQVSAVFAAAVRLDLYQTLAEGPLDREGVAKRIGCPLRTTGLLLEAVRALGLLAKDGDRYRLTPVAEAHLVPGRPMYLGDLIRIFGSEMFW